MAMRQLGLAPAPKTTAPAPAAGEARQEADKAPAPNAPARKIIYNADIDLVVEDFAKGEAALMRLMEETKGYLASADVTGSPGRQRFGTWKVRVPIERFQGFVDGVIKLGELQHRQTTSQDVTEEYYDLDARIKNKKVEEARLLKHLEESTGKLKEILDVEREISRVREEIERQEGRLRLLENLTALTTVTIVLHEREGYVPPEAPSFGTLIGRTFSESVDYLVDLGKAVVLVAVAVVPWLPVLALVGLLLWLLVRRARRRLAAIRSSRSGSSAAQ
ncbi:MAG TPA: DUF4349 domain-containing protein [Isosphaeraceae bacterium]|nr:DUF4349 domain-containing protein [Isosphaeraceae bacterium]